MPFILDDKNVEVHGSNIEIKPAAFRDLEELGSGIGGTVYKSIHIPSGSIMARKQINNRIHSAKIRKSLAAELTTLQKCRSDNIVTCYGAYFSDLQISVAIEYMDVGSFDWICKTVGPLSEPLIAAVVSNVLDGLIYLHQEFNTIHRDIKPSNILLNSNGQVKLCDFGESIQLVNSRAMSQVGTTAYMSPERINGSQYSITSDIWSLGITILELATGKPPFRLSPSQRLEISPVTPKEPIMNGEEFNVAIIELWEAISSDPSPGLDPKYFSQELVEFTKLCLMKDETNRPDPFFLKKHRFLTGIDRSAKYDLKSWSKRLLSLKNRLARGLSPF